MPTLLLPLVIFGMCGLPMTQRVLAPPDEDVREVCLYVDDAMHHCTGAGPENIVTFAISNGCDHEWYATAKDLAGNEGPRSERTGRGLCVDMNCDGHFSNLDLFKQFWHGLN